MGWRLRVRQLAHTNSCIDDRALTTHPLSPTIVWEELLAWLQTCESVCASALLSALQRTLFGMSERTAVSSGAQNGIPAGSGPDAAAPLLRPRRAARLACRRRRGRLYLDATPLIGICLDFVSPTAKTVSGLADRSGSGRDGVLRRADPTPSCHGEITARRRSCSSPRPRR